YTDLELTPEGERQSQRLGELLASRAFAAVLCSPLRRAVHTAELAGLTVTATDDDLLEWNYGAYEGRTTMEIRQERPGWTVWRDDTPRGESAADVGARADRVLERVRSMLPSGDVALVGHAHILRVLTARWLGLPPQNGELFRLETATLSVLGYERETPVLLRWNAA
ncbi:MAG TPA: histidine phosphatase family protein, partial [Candidatus Limnocylindrales bacterium]